MGMKARKRTVLLQQWEESERGWGIRPDGWTLHLDMDDHKMFVEARVRRQKEYFDKHLGPGVTPDEYTRISGEPRLVTISDRAYRFMVHKAEDCGIHGVGNSAPPRDEPIPDERVLRD